MRIYRDFNEARNEISRDLNELGVVVQAGYQSLEVDHEEFETKELENYDYRVLKPNPEHLEPKTLGWVTSEWMDRLDGLSGHPSNPGSAWKERREVWEPLLEDDGQFSYTYSERLWLNDWNTIIKELKHHNLASRQIFVSIWDPIRDTARLGRRRVPCTIGYHFLVRGGRLDVTYVMRSNDFATHWDNDCWLTLKLQGWLAEKIGVEPGTFTHLVSSLHVYAKDVEGVF